MPDGIELAKAYVQIVPSAEGIQGKITEALGGEAASAGESAGQALGQKLASTLKKAIAAAGIGKVISESINMGGALQQSLGGIETLFKDSADIVKGYAAQAYRTVGLSANDYMENTTSFAASLLSSVSQDTNAAAQLANMAMVDMADNANKMGTSMQDIQNAYQGFAKQNYTMLDNLKLGYGGTQAEMQRLLNDASKLSGVKYDLGNLADMYSAIHVIQTEMDITGTTAKEAATTLTGSFSAMKAAAENVLGNWSTGADLTAPLQALADTAQTYLVGNLLPMIGNILQGIPQLVYTLVPEILQSGTELVSSLAQGFAQGIPEFLSTALPQLLSFTEELRANAGQFVDAGLNLITQLANGLIAGLPDLIAYVPDIIINICGIINDNMPKILAEGVSLVVQLIVGIAEAVPQLLANWQKILQAVLSVISAINWMNIGKNILTGISDGVKSMASSLLNAFKGGFSSALTWIKSLPSQAVQWGKNLIQSFINGLTGKGTAVDNLATAATAGFSLAEAASRDDNWASAWAGANTDLADSAQAMADIAIPAYTKSGDAAAQAAKTASKAATEALQWSVQDSSTSYSENALGRVTTQTTELTEHLRKGSEEYDRLTRTVTESGREMVDGVMKNYKTVTKYVTEHGKTTTQTQKVYEEIASAVDTVTSTFDSVVNGIQTTTQTVTETLADGTQQQKQVITETQNDILNGMLVTVEKVKTIAADGMVTTTQAIKKASADSFSGLVQGWQDEANKGVLGTFSTLVNAVKKQDWLSVGQWVISTLYNGLAPEAKQLVDDLGKNLIHQINGQLSSFVSQISGSLWDFGKNIVGGADGSSLLKNLADSASQNGSVIVQALEQIGTSMGGLVSEIGTGIAGLASGMGGLGGIASSLGGVFSQIASMILANPEIAAIAAIVAGVAGLGIALFSMFSSKKDEKPVSHYESPFAKNGVYDSLGEFSTRASMQYRVIGQASESNAQLNILQRIADMLGEHLPDIGTGQVVMDSGELVGVLSPRMASNIDARMGVTVQQKARGV